MTTSGIGSAHQTLSPNIALERLMTLWKDTLRWCWVAEAPEDAFRVANLMREWQQGGPLQWALRATGYEWEWTPFPPREGTYILPVTLPDAASRPQPDLLR